MENLIVTKLEEEVLALLEELESLSSNTPEYDAHLQKISNLYKTLNEEKKLSLDADRLKIERDRVDLDVEIKREQISDGSTKFSKEVEIKKEQLKLEEKRIGFDNQRLNDEQGFKDNQLRVTKENFNAELDYKYTQLSADREKNKDDNDLKHKELKTGSWLGYVKVGVEVLAIGAPLVFYGAWLKQGFEFEEHGTITSSVFKGLIGKFKTTK